MKKKLLIFLLFAITIFSVFSLNAFAACNGSHDFSVKVRSYIDCLNECKSTTVWQCANCDETKTELGPSSHKFDSWTSNGVSTHNAHCKECGKSYSESHYWNSGIVTTKATCDDQGVKTYTCVSCGETKTESVPKLTHVMGNWMSYTKEEHARVCTNGYPCAYYETANHSDLNNDGSCDVCGTSFGSSGGSSSGGSSSGGSSSGTTSCTHSFSGESCIFVNSSEHYMACIECGYRVYSAHSLTSKITTSPTCTKIGVKTFSCISCKAEIKTENIEALGHSYTNGICSVCGATKTTETGSDHEHDFIWYATIGNDLKQHTVKCSKCDAKILAAHVDKDHDGNCDLCGYFCDVSGSIETDKLPSDTDDDADKTEKPVTSKRLLGAVFGMPLVCFICYFVYIVFANKSKGRRSKR